MFAESAWSMAYFRGGPLLRIGSGGGAVRCVEACLDLSDGWLWFVHRCAV